jgi:penicillin-binding protein 1C
VYRPRPGCLRLRNGPQDIAGAWQLCVRPQTTVLNVFSLCAAIANPTTPMNPVTLPRPSLQIAPVARAVSARPAARKARSRALLLLLLIGMIFALAACGNKDGEDTDVLPETVPDVITKMEDLPAQIDDYLARYNAEFQLSPRQGNTPLEVAETYLRRYQPGPLPRVFQHSVVSDRHGTVLAELVNEGRRTWVPLSSISPNMINATIATEDASFFENKGIDARRVIAALIQNTANGDVVSGASTITMQLARNLFFPPERRYDQTIDRKVFEMLIAQDLTTLYTKEEILEMYLNLINFGQRAYGAEEAAQTYFGKPAADLTLAEATLIAGIPQQPASLDPQDNLEAAKGRQRTVLDLMVRHGFIEQDEADAAFAEEIPIQPIRTIEPARAPHFIQYLQVQVTRALNVDNVGRAGLRITTTLDLPMQELAQTVLTDKVNGLRGAYNLNSAALVALRPSDAQMLVMVGSADYDNKAIDGNVNVATSLRQPGSSIKAVLYAAAFNDGIISPASILWDEPVQYRINDLQIYIPGNYDSRFHGPVTARTALANSYNVPAVKLIDAVGPDRMAQIGNAMGLTTLATTPGIYGLPLTLGANEVTLLDLTTAYHTLRNEGAYVPSRTILAATDPLGNPVQIETQASPVQAIKPEAAFQVTSILSDNKAREPAFGVNTPLKLSRPAAVKTGTTTSYRDNLTVGYTKYLVAGVWAGNPNGAPMSGVTGVTGAAPIWHDFMEGVIADPAMLATLDASDDPADWEFQPPADAIQRQIACADKVECPTTNEYFTRSWLRSFGWDGPTGDSTAIRDKVLLVSTGRGGGAYVGVCSNDAGEGRTYLKLPTGYGRQAPASSAAAQLERFVRIAPDLPSPSVQSVESAPLAAEVNDFVSTERRQALQWSRSNGTYLNFGSCQGVDQVVRAALGTNVERVYLVGFNGQVVGEMATTPTPVPPPTNTALPPTATLPATPTSPPTATPGAAHGDAWCRRPRRLCRRPRRLCRRPRRLCRRPRRLCRRPRRLCRRPRRLCRRPRRLCRRPRRLCRRLRRIHRRPRRSRRLQRARRRRQRLQHQSCRQQRRRAHRQQRRHAHRQRSRCRPPHRRHCRRRSSSARRRSRRRSPAARRPGANAAGCGQSSAWPRGCHSNANTHIAAHGHSNSYTTCAAHGCTHRDNHRRR